MFDAAIEKITTAQIRKQFDENTGLWYFSIVDIIAVITESADARNYWKVLKNRLNKRNNELVTHCNQLKMQASDGKMYLTDVTDRKTSIEIIKIISESAVAPFRIWFDQVERSTQKRNVLEKTNTPERTLMLDLYETTTVLILEVLIAGADIKDVRITAEHQSITIQGKTFVPIYTAHDRSIVQEISWGTFARTITLPALIELDSIQAIASHGLLKIILPKINISRTRDIPIKTI